MKLVVTAEADRSWTDYANCLGCDPDLFYPERGENKDIAAARRVCAGCVVRDTCAEYGIAHEKFGVWGGLSERERRHIRRQRRLEARKGAA